VLYGVPVGRQDWYSAGRAQRGKPRVQFHLLLDEEHRQKLVALSNQLRLTGADVIRKLIVDAGLEDA
jgi:hypothetical protein